MKVPAITPATGEYYRQAKAGGGFSLRERVRSGNLTADQALNFLALRESQGHHVNSSIKAWLNRQRKAAK